MNTQRRPTLPGFVAESALAERGRYGGTHARGPAHALYPAQRRPGTDGEALRGHFCNGVCWCCERYETFDCCYACAVCYIVQ